MSVLRNFLCNPLHFKIYVTHCKFIILYAFTLLIISLVYIWCINIILILYGQLQWGRR